MISSRKDAPEAGDQAVSEGAKKSNHALDVMGLDPKKLGFLPRTEFIGGTSALSALRPQILVPRPIFRLDFRAEASVTGR
jgi:hypothetical protein